MFLSFPLLLGLLVVATNSELMPALPGAATAPSLVPALLLLVVPTCLAIAALQAARRELVRGRPGLVPPRALLRLSALATPLAVHGLFVIGAFTDVVDELAQDSHLGRMLLTALPVYLAEVPRIGWSTLAALTCELRDESGRVGVFDPDHLPGRADVAAFVRMRLGGPLLVAMPLLLLGAVLDLLQLHRGLYVFVLVTTPGITLGALAFLLLVVSLLPFWFRVAFGVTPLPEPPAARLRATAAALGFRPDRLHLLPTGMRALNAMLVGPLPMGRNLCLTDGLVRELDAESLAGVVAHEVGHAKKGHPAILLVLAVVVPLLVIAPLRLIDFDRLDVVVRAGFLVGSLVVAWIVVRALAHRFEHEADVASVQALGAGPCTRALMFVARLAMPVPHGVLGRVLSLHPDEPERFQVMRRYELEPEFRSRFDASSRSLRKLVAALVVVAAGGWVSAAALEWRFEHVVWRLHAGDHAGALRLAAAVGEVPERWQRSWQVVQEELAVVSTVAPAAAGWDDAREVLAAAAWIRGEDVLVATGPAAARPWLALAIGAMTGTTAAQRALYAFCDAAYEQDAERMVALAAIVRRLGVPAKLAEVFAR